VGWDADPEGDFSFLQVDGETTFSELLRAFERFDWTVVAITVISLGILIFWDQVLIQRSKFFQLVQGPLVAVLFGIAFQLWATAFAPEWALGANHLVQVPIIGGLSDATGLLTMPDWSQIGNPTIWVTAVTLAIVASLETLLCVEATDKLDPEKRVTPTNRELLAQGVGNVLSGLVGGLPVTQVIVRSSANIQSGGRSKGAAIIHGVLLLAAVVLLAGLLNLVPLAVLASILLVVGYKLAKPVLFKSMYRLGVSQFAPFVITIAAILITDLLKGVMLGLTVGVLMILYRSYMNSHWVEVTEREDAASGQHVHLRLAEQVSFLSRGAILRQLAEIPDGSHVVIDLSRAVTVDFDVLEIFEEFRESAASRGLDVTTIPRQRRAQEILHAA
jgi:MFS superfamily sulfate permease-like transporter